MYEIVKGILILTTGSLSSVSFNSYIKNFVKVIYRAAERIYLVVLNSENLTEFDWKQQGKLTVISVKKIPHNSVLFRLLEYLKIQFTFAVIVFKLRKRISTVISTINGSTLILPILIARFIGIKTISVITGPTYSVVEKQRGKLLGIFCYRIEIATLLISNLMVVESKNVLGYYPNASLIKNKTFIIPPATDVESFLMEKQISQRKYHVGYIGRLDMEKGIIQFIIALKIMKRNYVIPKDFKTIIIGSGSLENDIRILIKDNELENLVELSKSVGHELIPKYLNDIRLLVLPSYSEGMPRIILESMACGTPVLATSVGAIPDVIRDGKTGFLLKSNDPKHIADRIIELLNQPELLERASVNASNYVRENFSYEKTLESWRKIRCELIKERQN